MTVLLLGAGRANAEDQSPKAALAPGHVLMTGQLTEKAKRRVVTRCDKTQLTYFMSEEGRFSKADIYNDRQATAKYVARRVLASELELLKPEAIAAFREMGISIRTREKHAGEAGGERPDKLDVDVGLRSGKPFLGTHVAGTRLTATWDWRRQRGIFSASRPIGPLDTRLELRYGDEREIRASVAIPLPR